MTKKPFFLKAIVLFLFFSFPAAAQETLPSDKTTVETQSDDVPAETAETTDGQSAAAGDSEKTAPAAAASSSAAAVSQSTRRKVGNPIMKKFFAGEWMIRFFRH